jgi:hypothetical protein
MQFLPLNKVFRREKIENIPKNKHELYLSLSHFRFSLTHYSESGSGRENKNWKKTGILRSYFLGYFLFFLDEKPYSKAETALV